MESGKSSEQERPTTSYGGRTGVRSSDLSAASHKDMKSHGTKRNNTSTQHRKAGPGNKNADLVEGLETKIRVMVDKKRGECDKLKFTLHQKQDEVEKLKITLHDLMQDSEALGLNKYPDAQDRLQPVTSVSRRPVYAKETKIHDLQKQLEMKVHEGKIIARKSWTYEHMIKRLESEKNQRILENNQLQDRIREFHQKELDVHKVEIASVENLGQEQLRLKKLKESIEAEKRNFERELRDQKKWKREQDKFDTYCKTQLKVLLEETESAAKSVPTKSGPAAAANDMILRHIQKHKAVKVHSAQIQETQYEYLFRSIGLQHLADQPQAIIELYESHALLQKELQDQKREDERRIRELKENMTTRQQKYHEQTNVDPNLIKAKRKELQELKKKYAHVKGELRFLDEQLQPVKIGIHQLLSHFNYANVNMDSVEKIEQALEIVERNIAKALNNATRKIQEKEDTSLSTDSRNIKSSTSTTFISDMLPLSEMPPTLLSGYNVRVQPDMHTSAVGGQMEDTTANNAGEAVMDRSMVKKISSNLITSNSIKQKKNTTSS